MCLVMSRREDGNIWVIVREDERIVMLECA